MCDMRNYAKSLWSRRFPKQFAVFKYAIIKAEGEGANLDRRLVPYHGKWKENPILTSI